MPPRQCGRLSESTMRQIIATALVALASLASLPSQAMNSFGTDQSDLWFNPNESGWGANLIHQQEVIFMTLFVYGPDNRVRWYVADALRSQGGANLFTFSGPLYEASGPYFGGAFNPAAVAVRQVGTATLNLQVELGTLNYTVDGATVTKSIQRQTFRNNNLSGSYIGGVTGTASGCTDSGTFEGSAVFSVTHSGSAVTLVATLAGGSCTYSGTYNQVGRMGRITGTLACTNGSQATFTAIEVEAGYQGFFTRFNANYGGGCTETGRIGGLKR
jgi:hypothetical protein